MLRPRIIPCLLVKNKGLVKTIGFEAPKYVGDPINAVRIFNEKEVDELMVVDIDATAQGREPDYDAIHHHILDMADALLARETLDADQVKRLCAGLPLDEPTATGSSTPPAPREPRPAAKDRPVPSIVPQIPPRPVTQE